MKYQLPEISWHGDRLALLSADIRPGTTEPYRLATSDTVRDIRLWDLSLKSTKGKDPVWHPTFVANLQADEKAVNVVRWSPDGTLLASADSSGSVLLWHHDKSTHSFEKDLGKQEKQKLSDDDLPNTETWLIKKRLRKHMDDVADLAWSKDGTRLATVSVDKSLLLWDVAMDDNGVCSANFGKVISFLAYGVFQQGLAWDPLGEAILTLGNDRCLHFVDVLTKPRKPVRLRKLGKARLSDQEPTAEEEQGRNGEQPIFHDPSLMSFVRRPAFSPCGRLLFAPAGQITVSGENPTPINATFVFDRCAPEIPALILPCPDKPTIAVRVCPRLFELRDGEESLLGLPYRVLWAVLSQESVILYSSTSDTPFAYVSNIHLCLMTDIAWYVGSAESGVGDPLLLHQRHPVRLRLQYPSLPHDGYCLVCGQC